MGEPIKARIEHVAATAHGGKGRTVTLRFLHSWEGFGDEKEGHVIYIWDEEPPTPPPPPVPKPVAQMNEGELRAEVGTMTDGQYRGFIKAKWQETLASDNPAHLREVVLELRKMRSN